MVQTNRNKLEPWIEKMILSHGSEQISSTVWLKAHVIGVGQMSQSQAQGSDGPTGLLFLSDGKVQIPAVLTKSAWEHLQEQEDRECFSSLVNTTVCLQAYRMQFHMALEETRCRFFLSIDKLATAATGPEKDNTPCCTTLPSVRYKICKTWESLLSHDLLDSQKSQCEFDLSDLLGEWQHNCVQDVLQDIRERLRPEWRSSPQPSTSSWEEHFSVPVTWLLIPDEETPGRLFVDSEDKKTGSSLACKHTETVDPCVDDFESRTARPAAFKEIPHSTKNTPLHEDSILREDIVIDCDVRILSNPWDIFPPPCDALNSSSSCSESITSEVMPLKSLPDSTATKSKPESAVMVTSTQRPISGSGSTEEEDARVAQSPPSWLFETQALSKAHAPGSSSQGKAARTVLRKIPTVHSDGTQFSYSYQVSGQSLQDMSKFEVTDGLLHWAVKYLLAPKQTDRPHKIVS
uniref:Shelterin complex subunit TPP1/Est3 domain-containing protein n=1 Tax=Myripristis murdjan TaxID=586833 RepID=A0A668A7Y1_9TELE